MNFHDSVNFDELMEIEPTITFIPEILIFFFPFPALTKHRIECSN